MSDQDAVAIIRNRWENVLSPTPDNLAALLTELGPHLHPIARVILPQKLLPKVGHSDIVQLTVTKAFQAIDQFQGSSPEEFWFWLLAIQRNLIKSLITRFGRARRNVLIERPLCRHVDQASASAPDEEVARQEVMRLRIKLLATLKTDYQTVIRLRLLERREYAEIGELMGRESSAVKRLYSRAIVQWRQACDNHEKQF